MKQRVISGFFIALILLATLLLGGYVMWAVSISLSLIAYRELMRACRLAGNLKGEELIEGRKNVLGCFSALEIPGYIGVVAYYLVVKFVENRTWLLLTIFIILMVYMTLYVFTFPKYTAREIMMSFFCLVYGPIMLTFMYMTRELPYGELSVWYIFACSWVSDVGAYFVGVLFGKHKLAPVLSPKKSIEGAIGGVVFAALLGGLFAFLVVEPRIGKQGIAWMFVIISAVGAVISQVGDLAASGIKRNENIKDYGRLIPGHGGIMDRFDSVIFTAPMVYALMLLLIHNGGVSL